MSVTLYPHQMDAINRMKNGSILVGGVGSGKSRTSLGYFYKIYGGEFIPFRENTSVIGYNLKNNMRKDAPDLYIITTARKRDSMEWEGELSVYLMSTNDEANLYGNCIRIDSWNNIAKYEKVAGAFFIFDEQRVGGTGKWAKTFIKIAKKNRWILLSATPGDTWTDYAPVFIANGYYKNFSEFRARHCVYSRFTKYPKIDHYVECSLLEKHRSDILVYMEFQRQTVQHHEYVGVQYRKEVYDFVLKNRWNVYIDRPCKEIAALCSVLRRVINEDSSRLDALLDIYKRHKRVICFYNYDYELEPITKFCESKSILMKQWNGHLHEEVPTDAEWIYLVQYAAGAEAWNCITTDCIVFYSQTYSYKASIQAAGRIDRMNTPYKDLYYYHFLSSAKMDLAINRCLRTKKDFNERSFMEKGGYS